MIDAELIDMECIDKESMALIFRDRFGDEYTMYKSLEEAEKLEVGRIYNVNPFRDTVE